MELTNKQVTRKIEASICNLLAELVEKMGFDDAREALAVCMGEAYIELINKDVIPVDDIEMQIVVDEFNEILKKYNGQNN